MYIGAMVSLVDIQQYTLSKCVKVILLSISLQIIIERCTHYCYVSKFFWEICIHFNNYHPVSQFSMYQEFQIFAKTIPKMVNNGW